MTALLRRGVAAVVFCAGAAVLAGCGPADGMPATGVVRGTIKYKGQPVTGGNVVFYPAGGQGREGPGQIGLDGSYVVYEAPPGETKVVVVPADPKAKGPGYPGQTIPKGAVVTGTPAEARAGGGPPAPKPVTLPGKYAKADTTPLTFTVKKGDNQFDIELTD